LLLSTAEAAPLVRADDAGHVAVIGTISGHVYEADNSTPIENATVSAEALDGSGGGEAITDALGYFQIMTLAVGDYRVRATATSHADEYYDEAGLNGENATPVPVTSDADTGNVNFTLDPGGTIAGTITDADTHLPLEGIVVEVRNGIWAGACTDSSGQYTLTGMPFDMDIVIGAESRSTGWCTTSALYPAEFWQEVASQDAAVPVQVSAGSPALTDIDFTLELGGTLAGNVFESDGTTPIPSANVHFEDMDTGAGWDAQSDGAGAYLSVVLPAANYRVRASATGYADEYYDEAGLNGDTATQVTVAPGSAVAGVDFTLDPGGTIAGTVTDADTSLPLAGIEVNTRGGIWAGACTDVNGQYTLTGLPLDTDIVVAAQNSGQPGCSNPGVYVTQYWQTSYDESGASPVQLSAGTPDAPGIDFALEPGGTLSGAVVESQGGAPIVNADVFIEDVNTGARWNAPTQGSGDYQSPPLPAGDYRVLASASGYASEYFNEDGLYGDNADPVTVAAGGNTPNVDFTLDTGGSIAGTIIDVDTNLPLEGIVIETLNGMWLGA
jgi:hypothetical protein